MSEPARYRSLFVGHGSPMLAISQHPSAKFLDDLGAQIPKPTAAIVISPHWQARGFAVKSAARYEAWHDFGGFAPELYELRYSPVGDDTLADRVATAIAAAKLPSVRVRETQIDHGVWVPLMRMWPRAEVPVVQVSVAPSAGPQAHWAMGEALRPLSDEGALVIGSGGVVHNLGDLDRDETKPAFPWAQEFDQWLFERLQAGDREALVNYRAVAPQPHRAHPTEEHLLPLFTAAAVGGAMHRLHHGFTHGSLSMAAYGFS